MVMLCPGRWSPGGAPHCGGCGAKVGASGLAAVLTDLAQEFPDNCLQSDQADDAAVLPLQHPGPILQSLDVLRSLVADPWLMGRIAANHALSDLYACGAQPRSALAAVTLPFARDDLLQRELRQVLAGALHEFSHVGCSLIGGHSMQGPEMQVGFALSGQAMQPERGLLSKRGACVGDVLILSKSLGTGVLFAAHMQQQADGRDVALSLEMMLQSNIRAAELALASGARGCTDITGFGLLGHLLEMLGPGQGATLQLANLPALPGALDHLGATRRSSGHAANAASAAGALQAGSATGSARVELLFDPQTSGGLLVAVSPEVQEQFCGELHQAGYTAAAIIGEITAVEHAPSGPRILLV